MPCKLTNTLQISCIQISSECPPFCGQQSKCHFDTDPQLTEIKIMGSVESSTEWNQHPLRQRMSIITNQEALFQQIIQPLSKLCPVLESPCIVHLARPCGSKTEKPEVGVNNSLNIDSMPLVVTAVVLRGLWTLSLFMQQSHPLIAPTHQKQALKADDLLFQLITACCSSSLFGSSRARTLLTAIVKCLVFWWVAVMLMPNPSKGSFAIIPPARHPSPIATTCSTSVVPPLSAAFCSLTCRCSAGSKQAQQMIVESFGDGAGTCQHLIATEHASQGPFAHTFILDISCHQQVAQGLPPTDPCCHVDHQADRKEVVECCCCCWNQH